MTEQLFKYAGYSVTESGQTKARFGNDMVSRIKKLTANDNTDTWFCELPEDMTKRDASKHLLTMDEISSKFEVRDALQKVVYRNVPKSTRTVNVAAPAVSSDSIVNEGTL
jgi:hypothetical protein|tara:strand:+ start:480 stop:809 length:330 start_codon:yes stop_codon:yes gene_type:complete